MFKKLLVPLDGSQLAEEAVGCAAGIARATNATIDLVTVHEPFPFAGFDDQPWSADAVKQEGEYLSDIAAEVRAGAGVEVTYAVLKGETASSVAGRVRDAKVDIVVMPSHARTGISRAWLGSNAEAVLRQSPVPVLVLRPVKTNAERRSAHQLFKRILVTLDGSALALEALPAAASLARSCGARLLLLRVVQPVPLVTMTMGMPYVYPAPVPDDALTERVVDDAKQDLLDVARGLAAHGLDIESHVIVESGVATGIIDFARGNGVDAIAAATHGRGASRLWLGSVADKLLRASGLPMLLYRPVNVMAEPLLDMPAAKPEEIAAAR